MRSFALGFILIFFTTAALAALQFPALTGRAVDEAHLLSPRATAQLDRMLAEYENGTSNQVVVVTLPSLQGTSIEDYGYQLGRYWGIGQKGKNNGVLLIVAPHEHKVRIEVGYGLEPLLTDAASSEIVYNIIEPDFRAGNMEGGIIDGTQAIIDTLGGHSVALPQPPMQQEQQATGLQSFIAILFLIFFIIFASRHPFLAILLLNNSRFGGSSSGGWSGGGGSFGGGGASGSW